MKTKPLFFKVFLRFIPKQVFSHHPRPKPSFIRSPFCVQFGIIEVMYRAHFLKSDSTALSEEARRIIEQSIEKVYQNIHNDLGIEGCEVLITVNPKKVLKDDMFLGLSYDDSAIYLFANADTIHKTLEDNKKAIAENTKEHCYRSIYTTARTKHIGLEADCGLLEEVINEGLAETFVTENMNTQPKNRYTQFSEEEIQRLWKKIQSEHSAANPDIEKWFWGNEEENILPFTACSVGYAIATAYLAPFKKKSHEALTVPAKDIATKQSIYY